MKLTRISSHDGYGSKVAIACIVSVLERQGRAVLVCGEDSTTDSILMMCSSPVPHAIVLNDFNPRLVDLDDLCSEPRLQSVLCFVEQTAAADPDDAIDDVLPLRVAGNVPRLVRASAGILTACSDVAHDDSEGGHHD